MTHDLGGRRVIHYATEATVRYKILKYYLWDSSGFYVLIIHFCLVIGSLSFVLKLICWCSDSTRSTKCYEVGAILASKDRVTKYY